jgi:hypothetical protein
MSTTVRNDLANLNRIATSKLTIASATTTSFDFGTPDDINLAALSGYTPGDRILIILTASTAGTTDSLTWVIQDANDSSGSIGTPATAVTSTVTGADALSVGTSDAYSAIAVTVQAGRPWLRVRATNSGTDSFVCHCSVYAVPSGL